MSMKSHLNQAILYVTHIHIDRMDVRFDIIFVGVDIVVSVI